MPPLSRFGAELLNVGVGVLAEALLAVLRLAGVIGGAGWREWSLLALSFVGLPWLLIGARLLSPALDRSFAVKEPADKAKATVDTAATTIKAVAETTTPSSD